MIDVVLIIFVFALGACVGSFLNVVIYRMPRGESIVFPSSHCPKCGRGIHWYDNVPIFSWLILRGKCRFCGVKISPQYILVEAFTGLLLVGLYVAYFVLHVRGPGDMDFVQAWPMFIAHAALLCGLLACSVVDIRYYLVPLPVMWTVAIIGAAAAGYQPHPMLASASANHIAMSLAAGVGLILSLLAIKWGYLMPSFVDADDRAGLAEESAGNARKGCDSRSESANKQPSKPKKGEKKRKQTRKTKNNTGSVAITSADGVNPRKEILREVLFLAPALLLAFAAWAILHWSPAADTWWSCWFNPAHHPLLGPRLTGVGGALFGFLIGGAWVWGTRILGTLGFGKEAMGLGDVHIMAGVGAVTGWVVPSLAFFVAPVTGLAAVFYMLLVRRQRELPYGPWLAAGTILVMLFYDQMVNYIAPGLSELMRNL